jgi:signal transduction histidine kinase
MTGRRPLRDVRTRLLAIVLVAIAVAIGAATYGFNVLFTHTSARDADALLRARADSERALLNLRNGRLRVTETRDDTFADGNVWIYDGGRAIESPRSQPPVRVAARRLAGGPMRFLNAPASDMRLYAAPIVIDHKRRGTVIVGLSLAPYRDSQRTALSGSLALAGLLILLVGIAVYLLLRSALGPVAQMTEQAAAWSEHDLDRRFHLGDPHDEVTRLGATLDGLLDRIAASLRRERRFSAELSHELRTPLANLTAEAELALRRDREPADYRQALERIVRTSKQLARTVDTLTAAAQQESGPRGTADGYRAAREIVDAFAHGAEGNRVTITLEPGPEHVRVGVDADVIERILQPVVENACRYGRSSVNISIRRNSGAVTYVVEDDGPGVKPEEQESIFEPGKRGAVGRTDGTGAGLGLALARRLARAAAGDVRAESALGGRFLITLPQA